MPAWRPWSLPSPASAPLCPRYAWRPRMCRCRCRETMRRHANLVPAPAAAAQCPLRPRLLLALRLRSAVLTRKTTVRPSEAVSRGAGGAAAREGMHTRPAGSQLTARKHEGQENGLGLGSLMSLLPPPSPASRMGSMGSRSFVAGVGGCPPRSTWMPALTDFAAEIGAAFPVELPFLRDKPVALSTRELSAGEEGNVPTAFWV